MSRGAGSLLPERSEKRQEKSGERTTERRFVVAKMGHGMRSYVTKLDEPRRCWV